ncbi:hypothetical protein STAFG_1178 [Streptomyces afghaniensis 772]|uniref:Uncharacterized protein n=1 Tax=Streptomyces afghaniensis 772 TaxID=1283301 RepID=S4N306_9ACTN|nr:MULTISPECIES: hypothetical protein [Streptomyces]EPJ41777.1 hypothetical protein STAFG_1178 [Streptomyces afghaniensis 772]UOB13771.1 hypothetical protein MQE23_34010 [Streptomyces sp. HP-A2021]
MTMRRDVHEELRARLHEAAGTHQPDREQILARVERGMAGPAGSGHRATRPPVFGWMRVAGATAAVAGVLAVGGYAVASAVKEETAPQQQGVATSPTPTPSPEATSRAPAPPVDPTPSAPPERRESAPPPSRTPSTSVTGRPPAATEDGPLWSDGSVDPHSNDFWAQSNVTIKTRTELTALTVRLSVAQTGGVSDAGAWRSLPEQDFTLTVGERDGFLVYTWTLKEGRKVPAGEWVFAGQFDHERGGRDAGADRYAVTAAAGSERLSVGGGFAAVDDAEDDS